MSTFTPKYAVGQKLTFADTPLVRSYRNQSYYEIEVGSPAEIERVDLDDASLTYLAKNPAATFGIWVSEKDLAPVAPKYDFGYDTDGDVSVTLDGVSLTYLDARSETSAKAHVETALKGVEDAQRRYDGRVAALAWHLEQQAAKAAEPSPEVLALAKLFTGTDNPGKDALRRSQRAYDAGVRAPAGPRPYEVGDVVRVKDTQGGLWRKVGDICTITEVRNQTLFALSAAVGGSDTSCPWTGAGSVELVQAASPF